MTSRTPNESPATGASGTPPAVRPLGVRPAWTGAESAREYPVHRVDWLVERQAARTPEAAALSDGSTVLSYRELNERAQRIARALLARGIQREDLVAVSLDHSIEQIVSILGVLMAGAAYVPIDPRGPDERRHFMFEDSQPRAILTTAVLVTSIPSSLREIILLAETAAHETSTADAERPPAGSPQDLAYAIYTSGSTGHPKGVLIQHDSLSNHLAWMTETFPLSVDDRVLGKTPALFDVSVWEWFWPLSQGACVVLTHPGGDKEPRYLLETIEAQRITNIHFVPTMLRLFLERPDLHRCRTLQRVICSGEALSGDLRDRFFARLPGSPALIDLYGPTETAVHVTGWVCARGETGPVPIGRPLPNVRAYIVDDAMNAVPAGVEGELLIGGVQVARGYLRRPELTAERFVPDPFAPESGGRCYRTGDRVSWRADGAIDYFGRFDSQVQIGGARVELGEIEAVLRLHPNVGDAAVMPRENGPSTRLVAYLRRAQVGGHADPSVGVLRRFMSGRLPPYMTPGWFVWLDAFPLTATGKLHRQALPNPDIGRPPIEQGFEAPRAGTETRIARLWRDQLRVDRVGRLDDFHSLGGDSLGAVQLCEAIADEFGIELPPSEFFRSSTVALLALRLEGGKPPTPATTSLVTLRAGYGKPPLFLPPSMGGQLFYWRDLLQTLSPGRPIYGFSLAADAGSPGDLQALAAAFVKDLIQFQPEGPYHLAGYSFSAAVALEMAQQLRASGRTVGVLAMIDYGPGEPDGWLTRARTAGHFLENLEDWLRFDILQSGWAPVAERVRRKLATLGEKIVHIGRTNTAQVAERTVYEMFDQEQLPEPHRSVAIEHLDAFYRYRPAVYDGSVLLFWARCRPLFHSLAPTLGWQHYAAGGFRRIVVECNHDNILKPPHVRRIAMGIDKALGPYDAVADDERRGVASVEPLAEALAGTLAETKTV